MRSPFGPAVMPWSLAHHYAVRVWPHRSDPLNPAQPTVVHRARDAQLTHGILESVDLSGRIEEDLEGSRPSRVRAVADVLGVLLATVGLLWIASVIPGWMSWERNALGGTWLTQILALMIVPMLIAVALGTKLGRLGIVFGDIGRSLEVALTALAVIGPASGVAFPVLGMLGWSPFSWRGGLVLAMTYAVCFPLTGLVIRNIRPTASETLSRNHLGRAAAVLTLAVVVSALTAEALPIVSAVLLAILVIGPGEELLFRGIVQSRLDQAFGRPWRAFGAELGWGWVLASLLFGLAHYLSPSVVGQGGWALWTTVSGLLFGYIRAKSGSFVAPAIVHGVLLAVAAAFVQ